MTKDGILSKSEQVLLNYSEEEIYAGVEFTDGFVYSYDAAAYREKIAQALAPGTCIVTRPIVLADDIAKQYGHMVLYKIKIITLEYIVQTLADYINEHKSNCIELCGYSRTYQSLYYIPETQRFAIKSWTYGYHEYHEQYTHFTHEDAKQDITFFGYNGTWHLKCDDGKLVHIGPRKAFRMLDDGQNFVDSLNSWRNEYIYKSIIIDSNDPIPQLECYSKKPTISYNGDKTWFSLIRCEVGILSKYSNVDYIKEHKKEILNNLVQRIKHDKKFINSGLTINFLKVGNMILRNDCTIDVTFQLKIETEDDVESA